MTSKSPPSRERREKDGHPQILIQTNHRRLACNFLLSWPSYVCPQVRPAGESNLIQGETMTKIFSSLMLTCVLTASMAAIAQDQMKADEMKKDDAQHDTMKNDQMKHDDMKKDKKSKRAAKKDAMKKDDMKHDDMKKDDNMKHDEMKNN
jgi:pentapeptide MXKDX repeat protein